MQVILDSSFAHPGSAPIWGGKKGEFRDWTRLPYGDRFNTNNQPFHRLYIKNISFPSFTDDECRIIEFKKPIENKAMRDHVIKIAEVINEGNCRVMCYMEPNCVSINFGPSQGGKYRCELNNASDENHMTVLEEKPTFTFLAIEVTFYRSIYSLLSFNVLTT